MSGLSRFFCFVSEYDAKQRLDEAHVSSGANKSGDARTLSRITERHAKMLAGLQHVLWTPHANGTRNFFRVIQHPEFSAISFSENDSSVLQPAPGRNFDESHVPCGRYGFG